MQIQLVAHLYCISNQLLQKVLYMNSFSVLPPSRQTQIFPKSFPIFIIIIEHILIREDRITINPDLIQALGNGVRHISRNDSSNDLLLFRRRMKAHRIVVME